MDLTLSAAGKIRLSAGLGVDIKAGAKFKVSALTQAVVNAPMFVTSTVPMPNPVAANLPF